MGTGDVISSIDDEVPGKSACEGHETIQVEDADVDNEADLDNEDDSSPFRVRLVESKKLQRRRIENT